MLLTFFEMIIDFCYPEDCEKLVSLICQMQHRLLFTVSNVSNRIVLKFDNSQRRLIVTDGTLS